VRELASKWAAEEEAADMLHARLAVLLVSGLWLDTQAVAQFGISGPYSHESLSVFLIHRSAATWTEGGIKPSTVHYLTLEQAMNQKKVLVHETNQVNELAVENISNEAIFIQAGDIVKGGNQDRMITNDFILSPHSGKLPIAAFCVEQGRWGQRGNEPARQFSASTESAALTFDPRSTWNQASVWRKVAELQDALASHLRNQKSATGLAGVLAPTSPSSLLLTQTSPPVEEAVSAYTKSLASVAQRSTDVVGYAFAVNGEVKSADLYASPELFRSMWPKLLRSSAVEALRLGHQGNNSPGNAAGVVAFLRRTNSNQETTTAVDSRTKLVKRDGLHQSWVESRDGITWVHRSVVRK
jgi:hypothetical protein